MVYNSKMDKKHLKRLDDLLENTGDMALKRRAKSIIINLDPKPGDNILDVGCGDGYYLHLISNLGIKNLTLTGTDFDKDALVSAKNNLKGKKIKFVWSDLMKKSPFKTGQFNKIVMSEVVEHLPDDVKCLKEVRRILSKGGTICISVPNANYPLFWDPINRVLEWTTGKHIESGFFAGLWNKHIRLYKPEVLKSVMESAGFSVLSTKSLTYWCLPFNHYIVNLTARAIHSGKLSPSLKASVNKYELKPKRPLILNFAFWLVNKIDILNDLAPIKNSGVGVFCVATKK